MLVYFEAFSNPNEAIALEKEIKGWQREKKLRLVLSVNPDWADLSAEWGRMNPGRLLQERSPDRFCAGSTARADSSGADSSPLRAR
jgi:hypothetical protein